MPTGIPEIMIIKISSKVVRSTCKEKVPIATHQSYIQPIPEEDDDPKLKRVPLNQVGTQALLEPDPDDPLTDHVWVERDPPLQVYCDYEVITNANGVETPILLCAETDEEDETVSFYGPDC